MPVIHVFRVTESNKSPLYFVSWFNCEIARIRTVRQAVFKIIRHARARAHLIELREIKNGKKFLSKAGNINAFLIKLLEFMFLFIYRYLFTVNGELLNRIADSRVYLFDKIFFPYLEKYNLNILTCTRKMQKYRFAFFSSSCAKLNYKI